MKDKKIRWDLDGRNALIELSISSSATISSDGEVFGQVTIICEGVEGLPSRAIFTEEGTVDIMGNETTFIDYQGNNHLLLENWIKGITDEIHKQLKEYKKEYNEHHPVLEKEIQDIESLKGSLTIK